MNHYGIGAFKFQVIELCERCVLLAREQVYLDLLFATVAPALIYNFAKNALAPMLGRTHTAETKAAMSEAHKGKAHTPEVKAAMSAARKGKSHSAETKASMSEAQKGNTSRALSVYVYDSKNVLVNTFASYTAAAEFLGITQGHVSKLVKKGSRTRKCFRVSSTPLS